MLRKSSAEFLLKTDDNPKKRFSHKENKWGLFLFARLNELIHSIGFFFCPGLPCKRWTQFFSASIEFATRRKRCTEYKCAKSDIVKSYLAPQEKKILAKNNERIKSDFEWRRFTKNKNSRRRKSNWFVALLKHNQILRLQTNRKQWHLLAKSSHYNLSHSHCLNLFFAVK